MAYTPRLKQKYNSEIVNKLKGNYKSVMQVPKLVKISLNQGVGNESTDKKFIDTAQQEMSAIAGQKALVTKSKKDISNFKVRKGMPVGVMVTLRGDKMYEFLDRLISATLPRVRDFKGVPKKGFDEYSTLGIYGKLDTFTVESLLQPGDYVIDIGAAIGYFTLIFAGIGSLFAFLIFQRFEVIYLIFSFIVLEVSITLLVGKKLYTKYSKFLLTQKILQFAIGIGLFFLLGVNGVLIGIALANFSLIPIFYKELRRYKIDFSLLKPKKEFIINNQMIYLISVFRRDIDKIIVVPILGFTVLGNFALTLQFFTIMMIISSISYKYLLPKDVSGEKNVKLKKFLILFSIIIAFSGFVFSPFFIENFFTKFSESIIPIQIASFCVIPSTVAMILFSKILALEKSRFLIIANLVQLCVILIGTISLGILYGIIGVTIAFILGNTVYAIILTVINYNYVGKGKFDI